MADSFNEFTAPASYVYTFERLSGLDDIVVTIDDEDALTEGVDYTVNTTTKEVTFTVTPTVGAIIKIARSTDISSRAVNFNDGSILSEEDLDRSFLQVLNKQQEDSDSLTLASISAKDIDGGTFT